MGTLGTSLVLGLAVGGRSSVGLAAPLLLATRGRSGVGPATLRGVARAALVGEIVLDKLPMTPSRLGRPQLVARVVAGGVGALGLALLDRRSFGGAVVAVAAGAGGAWLGSHAGAAWRGWAAESGPSFVQPDTRAAALEDAVVLGTLARLSRG